MELFPFQAMKRFVSCSSTACSEQKVQLYRRWGGSRRRAVWCGANILLLEKPLPQHVLGLPPGGGVALPGLVVVSHG